MSSKFQLRFALALLAAVVVLAAPSRASAQDAINRIVDRPSATLLLPYFEVTLNGGTDTVFTVNNASATAVLAHVTVYSDLAVPVLAFNVYLTGYDVARMSLRDVINGKLPLTASAGQDPGDKISPKGPVSQDINFASCSGQLPPPAQLPAELVTHTKNALTGKASAVFGNKCAGLPSGAIARGFVTVDTVNNCTLRVPGDPSYFPADVTNQNVLWGDYHIVTPGQHLGRGDALVNIWASATNPETSIAGEYTFYGRHVGWTATDHRQPLATSWVAPFRKQGGTGEPGVTPNDFPTGTSLIVWRDPKVSQSVPFTCGSLPSWYPLPADGLSIFNEAEDTGSTVTMSTAFGAATQRVKVGSTALPTPYGGGWIFLNLNNSGGAGGNPPEDPFANQALVYVIRDRANTYSVGTRATAIDSATSADHFTP